MKVFVTPITKAASQSMGAAVGVVAATSEGAIGPCFYPAAERAVTTVLLIVTAK